MFGSGWSSDCCASPEMNEAASSLFGGGGCCENKKGGLSQLGSGGGEEDQGWNNGQKRMDWAMWWMVDSRNLRRQCGVMPCYAMRCGGFPEGEERASGDETCMFQIMRPSLHALSSTYSADYAVQQRALCAFGKTCSLDHEIHDQSSYSGGDSCQTWRRNDWFEARTEYQPGLF